MYNFLVIGSASISYTYWLDLFPAFFCGVPAVLNMWNVYARLCLICFVVIAMLYGDVIQTS